MARKMVRQDWGEWTLDAYYPMIYNKFYYEGPEWIGRSVRESVETVKSPPPITLPALAVDTATPASFKKDFS